MGTAKVTSKGQITIPLTIRRKLGITPGSRVEFVETSEGRIELSVIRGSLENLKGMFKPAADARPVTLEEMDNAIAAEASRMGRG
jgi:antitoxin PrlF